MDTLIAGYTSTNLPDWDDENKDSPRVDVLTGEYGPFCLRGDVTQPSSTSGDVAILHVVDNGGAIFFLELLRTVRLRGCLHGPKDEKPCRGRGL